MKSGVIFLFLAIVLSSCKDNTPYAEIGSTDVEIVITNPTNGQDLLNTGEETHLDGRIDANAKLGGWKVELIDRNTGAIIDTYADLYEQTQYIVHHHWMFDFPDTMELTINVQALTVSNDVIAEKSLDVTCYP